MLIEFLFAMFPVYESRPKCFRRLFLKQAVFKREGCSCVSNLLVFYFLKWKIEKEWAVSVMAFSVEQYNNTEYSIYYVNRSIVFHDKTKEEAARS